MIFAVQVHTRREFFVKKKVLELMEIFQFDKIKKVHATESFVMEANKKGGNKVVKSILPGYIFIELYEACVEMPGEVYQFLKKVPSVVQVLQNSIKEHEFFQFLTIVSEQEEAKEEMVEMTYHTKQEGVVMVEKEVLHKINTSKRVEQKQYWLTKLKEIGKTIVDEIEELKQKGNKWFKNVRAYLNGSRLKLMIPMSFLSKMYKYINNQRPENNKLPASSLMDASFVVSQLLDLVGRRNLQGETL